MSSASIGNKIDFHDAQITKAGWPLYTTTEDTEFTYTFRNFFHPYVAELIQQLNRKSLAGMLDPDFHKKLEKPFFADFYNALASQLVKFSAFPPKNIDLDYGGPYANYNWELLFHVPLTVAVHLSKNQRFAEAQRWFHFIFDPTSNDTALPPLQRYWKFLPFRTEGDTKHIDELLALLSTNDPADAETRQRVLDGYSEILKNPFRPHVIARTRHFAYQYCVVMKYLDNLIAWGDTLFRQDTIETTNEATQRYILAANILGARPQTIPLRGAVRPMSYADLRKKGLDEMGNAMVELEGKFPFNLGLPPQDGVDTDPAAPLFGIGRTLFFCVPRNEQILRYWDTVADRLYKLRHCLNIEGVFRQLALFDPPIDPGMLVKAAAAGIDTSSIVSGLSQPLGFMRAPFMIQKALEICSEVRGLAGALLSALEKGDAERLALLRQDHEIRMQEAAREVRFLQWKQAQDSFQALMRTRASALERYHYYQRLLGLSPDNTAAPDTFSLSSKRLTEENFDESFAALVDQYDKAIASQAFPKVTVASASSPARQAGASGSGKLYLNVNEDTELNELMPQTSDLRSAAGGLNTIASVLTFIPDFNAKLAFWGLGAGSGIFGGMKMSDALKITAGVLSDEATKQQEKAGMISKTASYERRADDWLLQHNLAARELMQIGRQILGTKIAEQVAEHEYLNAKQQIAQSQEMADVLREKFTNEELYGWMQGEISRLYYEYYRFAFDTARKAEQIMKRELMRQEVDDASYVKFNYWDSGRKGLLSGEALYLDVKRMEIAYHENNKREYELTRHVSLRQLNPVALLALKAGGSCEVALPEWLFDLDGPGHYMRRIRNVSVSLPSVAGPYSSVSCTLSLLKSTLRKSASLNPDYARQDSEDGRFVDYFGTIQSIVTSTGVNDSGMFETNLKEERLLPFEGAGVESTWRLELPAKFRQFDYDTISDAILHVRYTARQGGAALRDKAVDHLTAVVAEASTPGQALLLDLRHEFPTEWQQFVNGNANFEANVRKEHFPYLAQRRPDITIVAVELRAITNDGKVKALTPAGVGLAGLTQKLKDEGLFKLSLPSDNAVLKRDKEANAFVLIKYSV